MIILVGASASGKTEVAKKLKERFGIQKFVTHTTRPMRPSEKADIDYHFVSKDDFFTLLQENFFVETTNYNGNYYGTSKKEVSDNKVLIVDPRGLFVFKQLNDTHIVAFYLETAADIRQKRMITRGDEQDKIHSRLLNDQVDFAPEHLQIVDYRIVTDHYSIDQVATIVYETYQKHLAALNA
ncbi:MAG: AAA family ATPase [Bacilli bacterium]|nr:AAA family ATPase [Bacilli bacterium]